MAIAYQNSSTIALQIAAGSITSVQMLTQNAKLATICSQSGLSHRPYVPAGEILARGFAIRSGHPTSTHWLLAGIRIGHMATLNGDSAADAMNLLQRLLREEGASPSLESFVSEWMVPQRRSGQVLLEHLRELLLSGAIGLEWIFNRTHVCLGNKVMDRHYRRRRSDCLSEGELAEFAGAVWRARRAAPSVRVQWQDGTRKVSDLRALHLSR